MRIVGTTKTKTEKQEEEEEEEEGINLEIRNIYENAEIGCKIACESLENIVLCCVYLTSSWFILSLALMCCPKLTLQCHEWNNNNIKFLCKNEHEFVFSKHFSQQNISFYFSFTREKLATITTLLIIHRHINSFGIFGIYDDTLFLKTGTFLQWLHFIFLNKIDVTICSMLIQILNLIFCVIIL